MEEGEREREIHRETERWTGRDELNDKANRRKQLKGRYGVDCSVNFEGFKAVFRVEAIPLRFVMQGPEIHVVVFFK